MGFAEFSAGESLKEFDFKDDESSEVDVLGVFMGSEGFDEAGQEGLLP